MPTSKPAVQPGVDRLQQVLGYRFSDPALLRLALTHRSVARGNNERLEFLGDSVVNHIIAEHLFNHFPDAREGEMSRMRAEMVKGDTLAEVAAELGLGAHLRLGPGERRSGGHRRGSILADALEAVIGAILLDAGIARCRECVLNWFADRLETLSVTTVGKDSKTALQEYLQGRQWPLPEYILQSVDGEDHAQNFQVVCRLTQPELVAEGNGSSRRKAEQAAAADALRQLHE